MSLAMMPAPGVVQQTVGISEMKISRRREDLLITHSLGSCVGVTLWDPEAGIGGLIHCLLPQSSIDPEKARQRPCMFVDSGMMSLLETLFNAGAQRRRILAKAAGGANVLDDQGLFRIGERNATMLRRVLWKNEILLAAADLGGSKARTLSLEMSSGRTLIRSMGEQAEL